jgi:hypothetical protein
VDEEDLMVDFLRDNPILWNIRLTDYRRKDKQEQIWGDQATKMDKNPELLKIWFKSLRDNHTRLLKKKSGDGARELTERDEWVKLKFQFLKTVTRHRPEPCKSVSITKNNVYAPKYFNPFSAIFYWDA